MSNRGPRLSPLLLAGFASVCAFATNAAQAALIVYDSFSVGAGPGEYLEGDEDAGTNPMGGQNPDIGPQPGFYAGGWIQSGGDSQAVKDIGSLAYPLFPQAGGQVQETVQFNCCSFGRGGREMSARLGDKPGVIYQSFLIDFGSQGTDAPTDFGKRAYEMWDGGIGDSNLAVDLFVNHFAGIDELTLAVTTASGTQSTLVGGGLSLTDLLGANLVVFKFEFSDLAADIVSVYLNPTDSIEANWTPAASIAVNTSDLFITHHGAISNFTFSGSGHIPGAFDELRWGDTFADVTPFLPPVQVPEPGSLGLLALALGALARMRRR